MNHNPAHNQMYHNSYMNQGRGYGFNQSSTQPQRYSNFGNHDQKPTNENIFMRENENVDPNKELNRGNRPHKQLNNINIQKHLKHGKYLGISYEDYKYHKISEKSYPEKARNHLMT